MSSSAGAPLPDFQLPYTRHAPGGQNGRVSFHTQGPSATGSPVPDMAGFQHATHVEKNFSGDMLRGNWERTPVSEQFFTRRNVDLLQKSIRTEVYQKSGPKKYQISDQSVDELTTVMRGLFLQYAKNSPFNVEGQIQELNRMVIDWCVPRILSEIDHYHYYLKDISHLPIPLAQPVHLSSAGTKSLPFKPPM